MYENEFEAGPVERAIMADVDEIDEQWRRMNEIRQPERWFYV